MAKQSFTNLTYREHRQFRASPDKATIVKGTEYKAAKIGVDQVNPHIASAFSQLAEAGAKAYYTYDAYQSKRGDERSNEILARGFTPEQLKAMREDGVLLYQDDPHSMSWLRYKTARQEAYNLDAEIAAKIANGDFASKAEMEEFRKEALSNARSSRAEAYGFNPEDMQWNKGWSSDIVSRNVSIYEAQAKKTDERLRLIAQSVNQRDILSLVNDAALMNDPQAGKLLVNFLKKAEEDGSIRNLGEWGNLIGRTLDGLAETPHGLRALELLGDETLDFLGEKLTVKEWVGNAVWNATIAKANDNVQALNRQLDNDYRNQAGDAVRTAEAGDPIEALRMINNLILQNDTQSQPNEFSTTLSRYLSQQRERIYDIATQQSLKKAKATTDKNQQYNRFLVIEQALQRRLDGLPSSMDYKQMPENDSTGKFTQQDMVAFWSNKLNTLDASDIPEDEKDTLKIQWLLADDENGALRTVFSTLIDDAEREWQANVIRVGQAQELEDTPALDNLERLYSKNSAAFTMLYPDNASTFMTFELIQSSGLDKRTLALAQQKQKALSRDEKIEADASWNAIKNNSKYKELLWLPDSVNSTARAMYDAHLNLTGNSDAAAQAVSKYLRDNYVTLEGDVSGNTVGVLHKSVLMIDSNNPDSWEAGRDMVLQMRTEMLKEYPELKEGDVRFSSYGNKGVLLLTPTGRSRFISKEEFRESFRAKQLAEYEKTLKAITENNYNALTPEQRVLARQYKEGDYRNNFNVKNTTYKGIK